MGYRPPSLPPRLNLDRHGMPRDYTTYVWLLYGERVADKSPNRRAFEHGARLSYDDLPKLMHEMLSPSRDTR